MTSFSGWIREWLRFGRRYISCRYRQGLSSRFSRVFAADGLLNIGEARLLYDLAGEVSEGCIVEIGSFHGKSAIALSLGAAAGRGAKVYAVDPYNPFVGPLGSEFGPKDRTPLFTNLLLAGVADKVWVINLPSEQAARGWREAVGLLWIDGDHSYEGVKTDFESWSPFLAPGGVIAFHDSLDERMGVKRLIGEILPRGDYEHAGVVDRTTFLRKRRSAFNRNI